MIAMSKIYYKDRDDAGSLLAERLKGLEDDNTLLLAIPNGGVPLAIQAGQALRLPISLLLSKKIPFVKMPDIGLGAVSEQHCIYNELRIKQLDLNEADIKDCEEKARADIREKKRILHKYIYDAKKIRDKRVVLIDDGISSGFTMLAAIKEVKEASPGEVIVATPIITRDTKQMLEAIGCSVYYCNLSDKERFMVDDYYENFDTLTNENILDKLAQVQKYK